MSNEESKVGITLDVEAEGKHFGYLSIPHSRNDSGWGAVHLPMVSIKNGRGPTLLFTGANHGDEYEGPIALLKLARPLNAAEIQGRVVIIPALNFPAVMAGTRVSPIDGVNMNRAFPGGRDGTVSSMIAHFVQHRLLPLCDVLVDIHSGGKTLMFSPLAVYHRLPDEAVTESARQAVIAFGVPIGLELVELDAAGMIETALEEAGKVFISTELGGGGTATTETVAMADTGVRNLLAHFGVIDERPRTREERGLPPTRMMHMPEPGCCLIAEEGGLYEPLVDLNRPVGKGEALGRIHFPDRPQREPVACLAGTSGTLVGRTHKILVGPGDFLGLIAHDM